MKKTILFFILSFAIFTAFSQGGGQDLPKSWDFNFAEYPPIVNLPILDFELIMQQDSINDLDKSLPWRYGIERPIVLNMERNGLWTVLPNGGKIWQATIKSPGALNLSVNFDDFFLPLGSRLQLFNQDRTDVTRTYTNSQNRIGGQIGTWFVEGDVIWIEYYQPPGIQGTPRLQINSVIHGYRMGRVSALLEGNRGMNDSGACNYDVNCPIGSDFDPNKDIVKKAVALLNLGNGYLCSAALLNNAQNDKTPYLLTANHCLENSNPALWTVRFNWVSPSPVCATGEESGDIQTNFTISGAELKAKNSFSDFALVELFDAIPESWDVVFAGWDNTDNNPEFEVGIHHPNGDIMKVCRDDSGATKVDANGTQVWLIGGGAHGSGDGWEIGTTESGSSGSPLFNENGKIIGQLYAGQSACNGQENNKDYDVYGRFGVSWSSGNTPETRLQDWLDPNNTGLTSIETLQNILNVPEFQLIGDLKIYPNPASTSLTVMNNRYPHLSFQFLNVMGQRIHSGSLSNTMNTIAVDNLTEGVYFLYLTDEDSKDSITKKIIIKK
ncbi:MULTISPECIES: T9SS type A sorting domain-containing protein [Aequorivita]|uniref:T9SS type A sorting domain-containing protein n=1 Tax=Aequorivita iocasae TaxID=2803865 RepID=A0ABX7DMZ8_9FLAO|nr:MULTISPECIES: T9SS type A sorting domain-containing protein [Aequorivita]QQX75374.1 T9SS type A sorting domain-containing protein [Aequorivita iocasae]UCA54823.1 T9SS type A sorting domain-containing protein [Aequorivita sp. F7]